MKMRCPRCQTEFSQENINIAKDLAYCSSCNESFLISELHHKANSSTYFNYRNPPKGASFEETFTGKVLSATTRSPIAFFLVPFMIVWSGGSLGGIYGVQFFSGDFNPVMSLFGIPFLIGSLIFWSLALMFMAGKVEITISNDRCIIFTGVGKLGLYKKINWNEIESVREDTGFYRNTGANNRGIILEGKTRVKFGSLLNEERRYYLLNALKQLKGMAL